MVGNEEFFRRWLERLPDDPAGALVTLWRHLQHHGNFEKGFHRPRVEEEAEETLEALLRHEKPRQVHPVAALAACDRMLASLDRGFSPRRRWVEGEGGDSFHLLPKRPMPPARWDQQPGNLSYWMANYQVVPVDHRGIEVEIRDPPRRIARGLAGRSLRFSSGGFRDGVTPRWNETSPYYCSCLGDGEKRWSSVEGFLERAREHGARVVVLPELTVDEGVLRRLRAWLRRHRRHHGFHLVVAGSFHVEEPGPDGNGPVRRNVSWALDSFGEEVLRHFKLRPLRTTRDGGFLEESIEGSSKVRVLSLPFGLVGCPICLDFCEAAHEPVARLWFSLRPALLMVPSMGGDSTNHAHDRRARDLFLNGRTCTIVAAQDPSGETGSGWLWSRFQKEPERGSPELHGRIDGLGGSDEDLGSAAS